MELNSQRVRKLAPENDPLKIGMGWTIEDLDKPQIMVESTFGDSHPGSDSDEGYFTETLARIYIKQGRYSKALEIIQRLSLNYPKKNAYFADQIRFLNKLIINNNKK